MCLNPKDLKEIEVKHSFQEFRDLLAIYFNPCDFVNQASCKSQEDIAEWMQDKDLLVLVNQEVFNYR